MNQGRRQREGQFAQARVRGQGLAGWKADGAGAVVRYEPSRPASGSVTHWPVSRLGAEGQRKIRRMQQWGGLFWIRGAAKGVQAAGSAGRRRLRRLREQFLRPIGPTTTPAVSAVPEVRASPRRSSTLAVAAPGRPRARRSRPRSGLLRPRRRPPPLRFPQPLRQIRLRSRLGRATSGGLHPEQST